MARWHPQYPACVACGGSARPHHSGGRCVDCVRGVPSVTPLPRFDGGEKQCGTCKRPRPLSAFWRDPRQQGRLRSICKHCLRRLGRAYARKYREQKRDVLAAERASMRHLINAYQRERYRKDLETNREIQRLRTAEYREKNREKVLAYRRAYYAKRKAQRSASVDAADAEGA